MNIAFVKLDGCDRKEYCFEVPDCLLPYIKKGTKVRCDTIRGNQLGTVTVSPMSGDGAKEIAKENGARFPLKKIIGAIVMVPISDIKVPSRVARSIPGAEKLRNRMLEFSQHGCFCTDVVISRNGTLLDGYTAYLVCKMWDIKAIRAVVLCC